MSQEKVLIIGSGPAGYTAAIYAARANLSPVVFTGAQPGGQLTITTDVENYPGFTDGILGPNLMATFQKQAERFGTRVFYEEVTKVSFNKESGVHFVKTDEQKIEAKAVIISTGASAKWLNLPSEQRLNGKGVSACAICDGYFFKDRDVAVVGGGDSAMEEASYLAKLCNKVYLLVRRDRLRASQIMQNRVLNTKNIELLWNTELQEVLGENKVSGIRVVNNVSQKTKEISLQGLFIAIGHQPNTGIFKGQIDMDSAGYIQTAPDSTKTNIQGVFACGDAQDKIYRQAITAAGTGCMAALEAEHYIASL